MAELALLITELRVDIGSQFNSLIIESFLYANRGMYTLIAAQALWKLRRKATKLMYSSSLIILWITIIFNWIAFWASSRAAFVVDNKSPITIFNTFQHMPLVEIVASTMCIVISDAILIQRCHVLWRKNYILISLLTLLTATTVLRISSNFHFAHESARAAALLQATGTFSSFVTTVSTTALIALKIFLVTRGGQKHTSYSRVLEILIQSAALVSIITLGAVILLLASIVHPFKISTSSGKFWFQVSGIFDCLLLPAVGISPTLIAFRVSEETTAKANIPYQPGSVPSSEMTFKRSTHTRHTDNLY